MILYVYKLTSPSSKVYIGQTRNPNGRWAQYRTISKRVKSQPKLYNALKKYDPASFSYEVIDMCYDQEELDDAEIYWIQFYDAIKNGYNCMSGGRGGTHSEETRRKLSKAHKGRKWSNAQREAFEKSDYIFKPSTQHLKFLHSGRDNSDPGMLGKKQSDHQKETVSKLFKDKPKSEEHKKKLSKAKLKYEYTIISPEGIVYVIQNLKQFCEDHQLNNGNMTQNCLRDKYYKGWRVNRTEL